MSKFYSNTQVSDLMSNESRLTSFLINIGALPSSVTRFGKISPLGRTFKNLGQTFEGICSGWQNFEQFWTIPNSQIMKNILVIWSHCCRLASSQGRYLWSSAWSGFDFAKVVVGKTQCDQQVRIKSRPNFFTSILKLGKKSPNLGQQLLSKTL